MRVANDYRSNSRAVYNKFCNAHPNIKVSFEEWKKVLEISNDLILEYTLQTGDKFKLPWGLGSIAVNKKKRAATKTYKGVVYNNLPIDWVKSKKYNKRIYHLNAHTDGYSCKWIWFRAEARFEFASMFVLKPSRKASRKLTAYLKTPNGNYHQIYKNWL